MVAGAYTAGEDIAPDTMISSWTLLLISAVYVALLFAGATYGEHGRRSARMRPLIHSLAIGRSTARLAPRRAPGWDSCRFIWDLSC